MRIALMSHDNKKQLMVQFCFAYASILSQHDLYATATTGHLVSEATGLHVHLLLSCQQGGNQQIGARIIYNEIDMVFFFADHETPSMEKELLYISNACAKNNIPFASNESTAEMLVLGMDRGDLDWRKIVNLKL